jgi:hypothetical protein
MKQPGEPEAAGMCPIAPGRAAFESPGLLVAANQLRRAGYLGGFPSLASLYNRTFVIAVTENYEDLFGQPSVANPPAGLLDNADGVFLAQGNRHGIFKPGGI